MEGSRCRPWCPSLKTREFGPSNAVFPRTPQASPCTGRRDSVISAGASGVAKTTDGPLAPLSGATPCSSSGIAASSARPKAVRWLLADDAEIGAQSRAHDLRMTTHVRPDVSYQSSCLECAPVGCRGGTILGSLANRHEIRLSSVAGVGKSGPVSGLPCAGGGHAAEALRKALAIAQKLAGPPILLTGDEDNAVSRATIEKPAAFSKTPISANAATGSRPALFRLQTEAAGPMRQ